MCVSPGEGAEPQLAGKNQAIGGENLAAAAAAAAVTVRGGYMMSSRFPPSSHMSFGLSDPAVRCDGPLSSPPPFLLRPPCMDSCKGPLRGPGPGLLTYAPPFQHHGPFSLYECPFEPALIHKRNERERQRVRCVNQGYTKLRNHLPGQNQDKRLSKVETLRAAIGYIKYLQGLVDMENPTITSWSIGTEAGRASQVSSSEPESEGSSIGSTLGV